MRARPTRLHLDLDLESEPISGHVGRDGAEPHAFTGYAGLIAALQSIRSGEPPSAPAQPADRDPEQLPRSP